MHCRPRVSLPQTIASAAAAMALVSTLGCAAATAPAVPSHHTATARAPDKTVQRWLTTPDQSRLLAREPELPLHDIDTTSLPVLVVDPTTTYQSMIGFGAAFTDASVHLIQNRMTPTQREALLQELFGRDPGVGFSFARMTMGASDFSLRHYTYDDLPAGGTDNSLQHFDIAPDRADKLPLIRRALTINPRLTLVGSPWSPPVWMKTNGRLAGGTVDPRWYPALARYFVRFLQAYAAEGVQLAAVTIQNEPAHEPADYPGTRLDAPARAAFIGRHLGPAFVNAGLNTQIWEWDHNWDSPEQPLAVLRDPSASRYIQGVAWHCYAGNVSAQTAVRDAFPDKDVYFTECSGGAWAPNFGDNLKWNVEQLIIGATRGWARGVALWNLALDEKHGPHLGGCSNCRGVVTITATGEVIRNVEYYALGHASWFVRPGAVRIASTTGLDGLQSVAFRNADDASVALIVFNGAALPRTFVARMNERQFTTQLPAGAVGTFVWSAPGRP